MQAVSLRRVVNPPAVADRRLFRGTSFSRLERLGITQLWRTWRVGAGILPLDFTEKGQAKPPVPAFQTQEFPLVAAVLLCGTCGFSKGGLLLLHSHDAVGLHVLELLHNTRGPTNLNEI